MRITSLTSLVYCLFLATSLFCQSDFKAEDLERKLFDLEDISFKKIDPLKGYLASYQLMVRQPIDHTDPSKGTFLQKVFLSHRSYDAPTVMVTEGYSRENNTLYELSKLLESNQVIIEHRYTGESSPMAMDYKYLTLENATADYHKINTLLKTIYSNDWVCTGISKGGQTTIFYRYFYPNDVEVSVPYVAPFNYSTEEKRIYDFLSKVGTKECRDKIEYVQKRLLQDREATLQKLKWYAKGSKLTYNTIGLEKVMELGILEYPFAFWQWGSDCEKIPSKTSNHDEMMDHFLAESGIELFSDKDLEKYASHYYQAGTQMGYYGYDLSKFKGLIKALPTDKNPSAIFMPKGTNINFDPSLTQKVGSWLENKADEFVFIYGGNDTWTATAVPKNDKRNSLWFTLAGKDHGQARIANLEKQDQDLLLSTIKKWLKEKQ